MKRRQFIALLGGAATAWPVAARAQQAALPVVGFINSGASETSTRNVVAFRKGLNETGYIEGKSVTVEYHWLEGQYDLAPELVADPDPAPCGRDCDARQYAGHDCREGRNRERFRSSLASLKTRSSLVLSPAWPGPAAMLPASTFFQRGGDQAAAAPA